LNRRIKFGTPFLSNPLGRKKNGVYLNPRSSVGQGEQQNHGDEISERWCPASDDLKVPHLSISDCVKLGVDDPVIHFGSERFERPELGHDE
jgi:hypothetical protein